MKLGWSATVGKVPQPVMGCWLSLYFFPAFSRLMATFEIVEPQNQLSFCPECSIEKGVSHACQF
jgi:hypothetical protein